MKATVWALVHGMGWDGGGQTISLHWTEQGAYDAKQALEDAGAVTDYDYGIEEMEIVD